jgi:peptide/nickel transport system permease protein
MIGFLARRAGEAGLVLLVMSAVIYSLIGLMPGDPIDLMLSANPNLTSADAARLKALYGLDRPILERYLAWAGAAFTGDFGYSRLFAAPVFEVMLPRLGNTILLMGLALAIACLIALPLGSLAALRPFGPADRVIALFCFAGISMPTFWLALMLITLFAVLLGWLPAGGVALSGGTFEQLRHLILPIATLSIGSAAVLTRYLRASLIESLGQDFVRTARAKGASVPRTVFRHALRHAMIPVTTVLALDVGTLFSGALVTETMFGYPGMGKLIYDAVMGNDFNLALVGLLFATATTLAGNFLADVGYAALDPRIGFGARRGAA